LLRRNPKTRLSSAVEIKAHRFFRNIDWEAIESRSGGTKGHIPPYIPAESLSSEADTNLFDTTFTQLDAVDSIPNLLQANVDTPHTTEKAPDPFKGFSYEDITFLPTN